MRSHGFGAGRLILLGGAATLVACQDGPTSPREAHRGQTLALSSGSCGHQLEARAVPFSATTTLAGVTVRANFAGLPWNIMQQMRFPLNYGAERAPCLNSPEVTYVAEIAYEPAIGEIPAPDGVNAEWWATLSPRERKALLKYAEAMLRMYPDRYTRPGTVIADYYEDSIRRSKVQAKIRAADFLGFGQQTELLAGGVYGCMLYRNFIQQANWVLPHSETLQMVIELVTAFAEAEFTTLPLRALAFGRNGAIGAAMAAQDGFARDCGQMLFESIPGGRITVTDPYGPPASYVPPPSYTPPPANPYYTPEPPQGSLPYGWWDM
ncbi:MAG: hypothetical protein U5K74_06115 [Gemmatimonadaceae bacterium]|nr:hypothetical protein [Gemmatimonadaceae bacterium]